MNFSQRTDWPVSENALTLLRREKEARGEKVLDLTESNPTRCRFSFYKNEDLLSSLTAAENLRYEPDPRGLRLAREAVCGYYAEKGIRIEPDQVFLTAGTSEAYSFLFKLLTNPGDLVRVPSPSYPLFHFLAELHDVKLVTGTQENTKAVIFVNPNNPTGLYVTEKEIQSVKAPIISDEVFLDFSFEEAASAGKSLAGKKDALVFTFSGISKILALPQMKLAWIVVSGPEDLKKEAIRRLEIIADTFLSVNSAVQRALPVWLKNRKTILAEMRARILENKKQLAPFNVMRAEAGWYSVLELGREADEEKIATELLKKHNVFTHPGYFFDFEDGAHLVLSHILPPEEFREAAGRMVKYFHG